MPHDGDRTPAFDGRPGDRRPVRVLSFEASLRDGSPNDRLTTLAATVTEAKGGTADRADLADFDSASHDHRVETEAGIPDGARRPRDRLVTADAFIIASPECNASIPGVRENALDWVSRYRPQPFNGSQGLLVSAPPSMLGGNRGLWALRMPLEHLGARLHPDMFPLSQAHQALGADGRISNPTLQGHIEETTECFLDQVEAARHHRSLEKLWIEYLGGQPDAATDRMEHTPLETMTGDAGDA